MWLINCSRLHLCPDPGRGLGGGGGEQGGGKRAQVDQVDESEAGQEPVGLGELGGEV